MRERDRQRIIDRSIDVEEEAKSLVGYILDTEVWTKKELEACLNDVGLIGRALNGLSSMLETQYYKLLDKEQKNG